jgi:protoporphyrinogen/coproporphyrinogen III oxidase
MAQYTVGHPARLAEIEARTAAIPGLQLAGNAYTGIGIPDCIRMGKQAAEAISKALCPV